MVKCRRQPFSSIRPTPPVPCCRLRTLGESQKCRTGTNCRNRWCRCIALLHENTRGIILIYFSVFQEFTEICMLCGVEKHSATFRTGGGILLWCNEDVKMSEKIDRCGVRGGREFAFGMLNTITWEDEHKLLPYVYGPKVGRLVEAGLARLSETSRAKTPSSLTRGESNFRHCHFVLR